MNLHVTSDSYGLYPVEIAKRIKSSGNSKNNLIVNLSGNAIYTDSIITYIRTSDIAFKKYIATLPLLDKIIFHPYNLTASRFLKIVLKTFPHVKVYWMCWSIELYGLPSSIPHLYEPFSANYLKVSANIIKGKSVLFRSIKNVLKKIVYKSLSATGTKKDYQSGLLTSYSLVHYFCSPFYSDFLFLSSVAPGNKINYLSIAYLSLNKIIPNLDESTSNGTKIMIGHNSSPTGNHYEIIQKLSTINPGYPILLPLSYGDKEYGNIIKEEAQKKFTNVEVLEKQLERNIYYKKLAEVGWAIVNAKIQQAVGNIIALIWMGSKVFLDKNTSTFKDFSAWGIHIYSIQDHLNEYELSNKLSFDQIENNRKKIFEKFNEEVINKGWNEFLY